MVIAGFSTSSLGLLLYLAICVLTAGIGYLVMRWVPRWRISLVGSPTPLKKCTWVVVEVSFGPERRRPRKKAKNFQNQWGEFTVHYVSSEEYGYPLSSVFTQSGREKLNGYRYDGDHELPVLRYLDYRYMRLIYHPLEDKFVLNNDWWDPQWESVKALREGLDTDERDPREQVFGRNMIEIQEKTIPELLLDEVSHFSFQYVIQLTAIGFSSFLHLSSRKSSLMVNGRILLLCCCHFLDICVLNHKHRRRNSLGMSPQSF